jgi:KUP system potassium uptake protein
MVAAVGALGVVYGNIGTSPLYALREAVKAGSGGGAAASTAVFGVVSLIVWSLLLVISVKYAILILRADNRGKGGILALLALSGTRHARPGTWRANSLVLGDDLRQARCRLSGPVRRDQHLD